MSSTSSIHYASLCLCHSIYISLRQFCSNTIYMAVYKHKNNKIYNRLQQYFSQIETEHYHKLKDAEFKLQPSVDFICYENADVMRTVYNLGHCSHKELQKATVRGRGFCVSSSSFSASKSQSLAKIRLL